VTSSQDGAAYVWDVVTGQRELLLVGATGAVNQAVFSPDGGEIATASDDRLGRIYYSQDGRLLTPLAGHANAVTSVGFDPSGRTVVTGSSGGTARLWDALPQGTLHPIFMNRQPLRAVFAGGYPAVVTQGGKMRLSTITGRELSAFDIAYPADSIAARNGTLAVADNHGDATVMHASGALVSMVGRWSNIDAVAFAPDGTLLTGATDGEVKGWDVHGSKARRTGLHLRLPRRVVSISVGGGRFLVRLPNELRVYTDDGALVSTIHTTAVHAVLSPGGLGVATTKGKVAQLWDASSGMLLHTLVGHRSFVNDAEYSPNGRELVTVSDDHTGRVWDTRTGHLLHVLVGHFFAVNTGSFSPDGHWIVTSSQFTAGLWNADTGQLLFYLGRDAKPLTGASFSPTGNWILTGSEDGTARVYHCAICEPLAGLEATARARIRALR
jgi:WD40 repeat protein